MVFSFSEDKEDKALINPSDIFPTEFITNNAYTSY